MDDNEIYVGFLVGVGRNSVTFATVSQFTRFGESDSDSSSPEAEYRSPRQFLTDSFKNEVLYKLDRQAIVVSDWASLFKWLGRDVGTWATFTEESAEKLVPQWFSPTKEYLCRRIGTEIGSSEGFVAVDENITDEMLQKLSDITGDVDTREG